MVNIVPIMPPIITRLIDFAAYHNQLIKSKKFEHKNIPKII